VCFRAALSVLVCAIYFVLDTFLNWIRNILIASSDTHILSPGTLVDHQQSNSFISIAALNSFDFHHVSVLCLLSRHFNKTVYDFLYDVQHFFIWLCTKQIYSCIEDVRNWIFTEIQVMCSVLCLSHRLNIGSTQICLASQFIFYLFVIPLLGNSMCRNPCACTISRDIFAYYPAFK